MQDVNRLKLVLVRTWSESIYSFQVVYQFFSARY